MSSNLDTLLANIDHAVRNRTKTEIGGGVFDPTELRLAANEIRRLQECNERLERDNKLMQVAFKQVVDHFTSDARDDPFEESLRRLVNAAYRHVSGT